MKKNAVLFSVLALSFIVGLIACSSSSKYTPAPTPAAFITISQNNWVIQSVLATRNDGVTFNYTSTDTLGTSRLAFGADMYGRYAYAFGDKNNTTWSGPKNDTTIFRYSSGLWTFDNAWVAAVTANNLSAMPDSLIYQGYLTDSKNSQRLDSIIRCKINQFDSLHLTITYIDSSVVNPAGGKYKTMKTVYLQPIVRGS